MNDFQNKELKLQKKLQSLGVKNFLLLGTLTGSIAAFATGAFLIKGKLDFYTEQKEMMREATDETKKLYMQYQLGTDGYILSIYRFYDKAAMAIAENDLAVITPRIDGYLTIDEEGYFKWVSLDGKIYNSSKEFLESQVFSEVSDFEREKVISQNMGIEKQTSFSFEEYLLVSKKVGNQFVQFIYKGEQKIGEGIVVKTAQGHRILLIDSENLIQADNLYEFAVLDKHRDSLRLQYFENTYSNTQKKH